MVPIALAPAPAAAAALEYAVKANFLYKFAPFVRWPANAFASDRAPFQICVAGADPFGSTLDDAVRGQRIDTRAIAIRRMQPLDPVSGCQILFVGELRGQTAVDIMRTSRRQPVLIVTDERQGNVNGAIRFVIRGGRVRFVINRANAASAGLTISSKLLELAVAVEK
ncbi:MAG TPA: YfiR family protein [Sphingomonas sp.]|nr:YfiR family protein [Sphingomonas sp.]